LAYNAGALPDDTDVTGGQGPQAGGITAMPDPGPIKLTPTDLSFLDGVWQLPSGDGAAGTVTTVGGGGTVATASTASTPDSTGPEIVVTATKSQLASALIAQYGQTNSSIFVYEPRLRAMIAVHPTIYQYAQHWTGADGYAGVPVYRMGSDVDLSEYSSGQFDVPAGTKVPIYPSDLALATAAANYPNGGLPAGPLTDTFLYGSLGRVQILNSDQVQLSPDTFNFDMEAGRDLSNLSSRNLLTWEQHQLVAGGRPGENFQTIFIGPTNRPPASPPTPDYSD
jgi:hypothetical protein